MKEKISFKNLIISLNGPWANFYTENDIQHLSLNDINHKC